MTEQKPAISVIVPVKDSKTSLRGLLSSLRQSEFPDFEVVINDDPTSSDDTESLIREFDDLSVLYMRENISRAHGRRRAAKLAQGRVFLHLDSDMTVTSGLLRECLNQIDNGNDALVIPEQSFGNNVWARARAVEKRIYDGVASIEALRCVTSDCYWSVGGHNEDLVWSEDKDLDLRVRNSGAEVGRTVGALLHNEGSPTLVGIAQKKIGYLGSAFDFAEVHPVAFSDQVSLRARTKILINGMKLGFRSDPFGFACLLVVGAVEFSALCFVRLQRKLFPSRVRRAT